MAEPTDGELVDRTREGDRDAYSTLVARYQGHVYGLAYSLAGNWADAQDIAQETFIRAYVNLEQLRDPARFAPWLRRVTFGVAMNWLKAFRAGFFHHIEGQVDLDSLEIPDFAPGPAEVVEKRELADAVQRAIASLPPKYRVPLTMFHLDGLSYQKVAQFMDIPLGTVQSLIHRARAKLRVALAAHAAEEVSPMLQEVFNEHKLPPEFSRDVWRLCMDWLYTGDKNAVGEPIVKKPDHDERMALAAARDPDVAMVNEWRKQAGRIPKWALDVDRETPRWGIEICHHAWIEQLERSVWMIGNQKSLPSPAPGMCCSVPTSRRLWATLADDALSLWLTEKAIPTEDSALIKQIHSALGPVDDEKADAVRLLQETLRVALALDARDFDAAFAKLETHCDLAREMRDAMSYLQFTGGYRWEKIVVELCRAIGDPEYRASKPLAWHVGACNGQAAFVHRDDPLRVPTTCAILVGVWAWLREVPNDVVASAYPALAGAAERIRHQLGEMTSVKRWLAGRLFVGIRIWLQEVDHGDIKQPRPAMDPYPTLSEQ